MVRCNRPLLVTHAKDVNKQAHPLRVRRLELLVPLCYYVTLVEPDGNA